MAPLFFRPHFSSWVRFRQKKHLGRTSACGQSGIGLFQAVTVARAKAIGHNQGQQKQDDQNGPDELRMTAAPNPELFPDSWKTRRK